MCSRSVKDAQTKRQPTSHGVDVREAGMGGPGSGVAVLLAPRACVVCDSVFQPSTKTRRCCGVACGKAHVVACAKAKRLGDTEARERLRARRNRSSDKRRAAGWKSGQKGRWIGICQRDGWVCWICNRGIDPALRHPDRQAGTADHVIPLALGGSDEDDNLRAAHLTCNSRRGRSRMTPATHDRVLITSFSMSLGWPTTGGTEMFTPRGPETDRKSVV